MNRHGIEVIGFSSDGDTRLLSAMKNRAKLDLSFTRSPVDDFKIRYNPNPICVQDTIHIGTKLRNRLLNTSVLLTIGNEIATIAHIRALLNSSPKEIHGLVFSDICPEDRQNFASLQKIMEIRVLKALENHIANSKATIKYLQLCKDVTSSFIEEDLRPIERVYRIWHSLYFLRCWRKWIQSMKNYSLAENFISLNAFTCIEINAHAVIDLILKLRSSQQQHLFRTQLFASQPCESIFRQMRSMGTANYTKINFTLNELLHMIARVEMMNKIIYSTKDIEFPRNKSDSRADSPIDLPSDQDIYNIMIKAQTAALEEASQFGIVLKANDISECEIPIKKQAEKANINPQPGKSNDSSDEYFSEFEDDVEIQTKDMPGERTEMEKLAELSKNKFVEIINPDGSTQNVRKSTLIWILSESKDKLSSDRLERVRGSSDIDTKRKKKLKRSNFTVEDPLSEQILYKSLEVAIGEWALFKVNDDDFRKIVNYLEVTENILMGGYLIGFLLGFRYTDGKGRHKQYKLDYASIENDPKDDLTRAESRENDIEVLGAWYTCEKNDFLRRMQNNSQITITLKDYVATMKNPTTKKIEGSDYISYVLPCAYSDFKAYSSDSK